MSNKAYKTKDVGNEELAGVYTGKYSNLLNNIIEGVAVHRIIYDNNGEACNYELTEVSSNFERLLSLNRKDILNKPATEVFKTEIPPYLDMYSKIAETGAVIRFETYFPTIDKYFNITAYSESEGHFTTLFRDITEIRRMQEELKTAKDKADENNRLKSSLLTNLSHEFRTPMTGILGMSSILKDKLKAPENRTMLDYITSSGNRLMKTLNAILDLAEDESNEKNMELVALYPAAEPALEEYMAKASAKGISFKCDIYDNNLAIISNERILLQIFRHMLDNAVKFTEQGGVEVVIKTEKIKGVLWAKITFKDTGIGIKPKDQGIIFDEFRQVSEGISRSFEGVGLGLTLVKKMVGFMKGKITLESESGKGSLFTIYLPAVITAEGKPLIETESILTPKHESHEAKEPKPLILLVEDNLINIKVTQVYLQDEYSIDYAKNGLQALKLAEEKNYDMILMDINLGVGMDGVKTAKAIRELKGYKKTPIVALTGYAMESEKEKLFSEGLTHHLSKPFDKETLKDFVESVLAKANN